MSSIEIAAALDDDGSSTSAKPGSSSSAKPGPSSAIIFYHTSLCLSCRQPIRQVIDPTLGKVILAASS